MTMRKYRPTERDKEIVLRMAAIPGISRDNIAFCITNERTNRAIDRHTLEKNFAKELELATSHMQNLVMKSFIEMIAEKNWPAVKTGLINYCGVKDDGGAVANANVQVNLSRAEKEGIVVQFQPPTKRFDDAGNVIDRSLPPPESGPRPMNQSEHTDQRYPHRIDGAAPDSRHVPPPPDPVATPSTAKERKEALAERFEAEGLNGWSNVNPRSSYNNPNRLWDRKTRSYK